MNNYNKVILMGKLVKDPEIFATKTGGAIASLRLAVNRKYLNKNKELQEDTTFVDVKAFGNQVNIIQKFAKKGKPMLIEGYLNMDSWQNTEGKSFTRLNVVAEFIEFVGEIIKKQNSIQDDSLTNEDSTSNFKKLNNIKEDDEYNEEDTPSF